MVGCEGCSRAAVSVLAGTTAGAAKERASDATASIAEKIKFTAIPVTIR